MLKTYRMIPLVFILFLFGFTLITVSPVIAEDSPEFVACQQIKPRDIQTLKNKKDCFRDLARALVTGGAVAQANGADSPEQVSTSPSGGEVAELNARIAESESQVATLTTTNAQLQEYLRSARAALVPLNAGIAELEPHVATLTTTNAQLQEQLMSASAALEPLNAKVAELETRVSAANAAQEPLNAKVTELETQVSAASAALDQANENIAILNNHVETAAGSPCEAREASITEQYMTLNDNATMLVETNHNLADKLQIHEQGVAHMAILLDKMISHHAYHKRKSHKSSRSALVIHESMRYELSCMSSHVDDVAFCARISAMPPGKRESGSVYLHKFE